MFSVSHTSQKLETQILQSPRVRHEKERLFGVSTLEHLLFPVHLQWPPTVTLSIGLHMPFAFSSNIVTTVEGTFALPLVPFSVSVSSTASGDGWRIKGLPGRLAANYDFMSAHQIR